MKNNELAEYKIRIDKKNLMNVAYELQFSFFCTDKYLIQLNNIEYFITDKQLLEHRFINTFQDYYGTFQVFDPHSFKLAISDDEENVSYILEGFILCTNNEIALFENFCNILLAPDKNELRNKFIEFNKEIPLWTINVNDKLRNEQLIKFISEYIPELMTSTEFNII